jgi:hypothetical protein
MHRLSCWTYPYNPPFWFRHESLFNAVNTVTQPNIKQINERRYSPPYNRSLCNTEILLAGKRKGRVFWTVSFLRTLDPIRAELNRGPAPWRINEVPCTRPQSLSRASPSMKSVIPSSVSFRAERTPPTPPRGVGTRAVTWKMRRCSGSLW